MPTASHPEVDPLTVHARAVPDKPAVIDADSGGRTTFAELEEATNRLAHGLLRLGAAAGERIIWCGPNSLQVIMVLHAVRKAGLVGVPLSYRFTSEEMRFVIGDSGAGLVVADAEHAATIASLGLPGVRHMVVFGGPPVGGALAWEDVVASGSADPLTGRGSTSTAMIYTSGTTGRPKGALRDRSDPAMTASLAATLRLRAGEEVHLTTGPLYHSGPLAWAMLNHQLGGTVVLMRRFEPARWLELVREYRVTNTFTAPTPLKRIVSLPADVLGRADLSSMRSLVANAAPVPFALKQEIVAKLGDGFLFEVYGSTELGVDAVLEPEEQLRKPGSCGRALPGVELRIVGADGLPAPVGVPGELFVRSPVTFSGYHGRPGRVDDGEGWKSIGDIAYLDDEGYLHICDRGGDLVITGGMNVYPAEVEGVLHAHPDVLDAAVFGVPSAEWGESVHAVVAARPGREVDPAALDAYLAGRLAGFKRPRSWEIREELPRTESGKLLKRVLRDEHLAAHRGDQ